ncbi:hypothetical protein [Streptomyces natalensis]|uniref:Uncharacterized protein n=1 Tax=Streptomyces natalensis ATCC 27448 TaxID=1240678 RepID=A0A0D7CND9_9ACTN|nr:hypothetical protein [Streptomyces natalensis]KIZ17586.1 hypothetical protein SNA_13985 [Streptomyces natalensis ATCC 27448]
MAHHLLKLELTAAVRDAGAHAELEVRGPEGVWRADVLASDAAGAWKMALEAPLLPITLDDIAARTEVLHGDPAAVPSPRPPMGQDALPLPDTTDSTPDPRQQCRQIDTGELAYSCVAYSPETLGA